MGIAVQPSPGSALIGAGIGALIGGALGYLGHKDKERREALFAVAPRKQETKPDLPFLRGVLRSKGGVHRWR